MCLATESFYVCFMNEILFELSGRPVTVLEAAIAGGLFLLALIVWLVLKTLRQIRERADADSAATERIHELESHLSQLLKSQGEMTGRMQTMAEVFGTRQSDMMRAVNERLDGMGHKLGLSMSDTTKKTQDGLRQLHERLAVIDRAQRTITDLSGQVGQLQAILSKQADTRRLRSGTHGGDHPGPDGPEHLFLSGDALQQQPSGLSDPHAKRRTVTCDRREVPARGVQPLAQRRNGRSTEIRPVPISARTSRSTSRTSARSIFCPAKPRIRRFCSFHLKACSRNLNEGFEDLIQKAHRSRVVIVSPSLLMLSIQVIQSVLRDAKMREQAHLIQAEVGHLITDVGRLNDRVGKLQSHFAQANKDIDQILISTDKITKRSRKIEDLELGEVEASREEVSSPEPQLSLAPKA